MHLNLSSFALFFSILFIFSSRSSHFIFFISFSVMFRGPPRISLQCYYVTTNDFMLSFILQYRYPISYKVRYWKKNKWKKKDWNYLSIASRMGIISRRNCAGARVVIVLSSLLSRSHRQNDLSSPTSRYSRTAACHVLHKCHRCNGIVVESLPISRKMCHAAFGRFNKKKKSCTSVVLCGIAAACGIRYRDHVLDAMGESAGGRR